MANVLIVEDDKDIADLLGELLADAGHRVRIARHGEEGLSELARGVPDVVLLDVEMPVLNGPEMAYQMFVHDCGLEAVPIVLLSGVVNLRSVAARVGTPYFLAKPYSPDAVLALCEKALLERKPPKL